MSDTAREMKLLFLEGEIRRWNDKVMELGAEHDVLSARFKRAAIMRDSVQQEWEDFLNEDTDHS